MKKKVKPVKDLWIILHHHRHGADAFLVRSDGHPSDREVTRALKEATEFDLKEFEEWIDYVGPWLEQDIKEIP